MSVRELHLRKLLSVEDMGIDTGFGVWSTRSSEIQVASSIGFADLETIVTTEEDMEMRVLESLNTDLNHDV